VALIRFQDGDVFELRIISTMHADEGGDIVAELVRTAYTKAPDLIPDGSFINFDLADVDSIALDGVCIFGLQDKP
jgi:hypothetical protein